ncbi:MAG: alkaline phosphatase family protein [Candidatus Brocadia sinica]|nr:alkaline phosphatase family protein [Candidatus Brocadia sinica]NUO06034.1 alkaline phosphatase family protein [Candidatus Brocadia sinica]
MNKPNKIVIIGLDGATWDIIHPMIRKGQLPTFKYLIENGSYGNLNSTIPPLSAPAWTSAFTGVNPGKHNIFDFFTIRNDNYELRNVTSNDRKTPAIWNILDTYGMTSGIFNMPMTYPPEAVNGFMVAGLGTPDTNSNFIYPASLKEELKNYLHGLQFSIDVGTIMGGREDAFLDELYKVTDIQEKAVHYLYNKYQPDLFMAVFDELDRIQHFFWRHMETSHPLHDPKKSQKYKDAIEDYYQHLDIAMKRFLDTLPEDTTVMIVSDHGFGGLHKDFYINKYFYDMDILSLKLKPPLSINTELLRAIKTTLKKLTYKMGVGRWVDRMIPDWLRLKSLTPTVDTGLGSVDWSQTKAYFCSLSGQNVWINLKGRQPEGIIEPGKEYEALRDQIIEKLYTIKDPKTSKNIIQKVYRREEIYTEDLVSNAPDLIIDMAEGYVIQVGLAPEMLMPAMQYKLYRSGCHRQHGIFIAIGKDIKKNHQVQNAEIIDIVPTVLYLLNKQISTYMDGKVLTDILNKELKGVEYQSIQVKRTSAIQKISEDEEAKIAERLKGLGYMG